MKKTRIERIIEELNSTFHGGAWHGPSVLELIKDVKPKSAGMRHGNAHTIAELVYHITSWRIFTVKKLQGDIAYNISTEKQNWGNLREIDEFEWETLQMELTLSHDELMKSMAEKTDDFLDNLVPGSEYDFHTLLTGIINHDLYHAGQMAILKKMGGKTKKFNDDEDDFGSSSKLHFNDDLEDEY